ncbi:MAG: sulfite exporter TauE/SafE family protein [Azovibrio sp.]
MMSLFESIAGFDGVLLLLIVAVFVIAGLVKGVVGLGLPTVSMALLALLMTPAEAVALLIVPSLITNVWQIRPWTTLGLMFRRLGPMLWGVCLGTLLGAWGLGAPAGAWATVFLGVVLVGYGIWGLAGTKVLVKPEIERWLGPLAGGITGMVTAATGVFVIPAVPYLQGLGLQRDELIQAMGISFTVSTLVLAAGLYLNGGYSGAALGTSVLMLLPAIGGMYVGQVLRQKLVPAVFRRCFMGSLILLGVYMVGREMLAQFGR